MDRIDRIFLIGAFLDSRFHGNDEKGNHLKRNAANQTMPLANTDNSTTLAAVLMRE